MPGINPPLYYWDTCLFLAWLKDEERNTGEMDGIRDIIQRMKRRDAKVMTSVLTTVEVLAAKIPVGIDSPFKDLLKRINRVSMDVRVATLAHDLRNHYALLGRSIKAPDAIHLATPLFDVIGQRTFVVSETPKAANLVKLSGNFLIASVIESLGEAMALVGKGGVDKRQYLEILTSTLFGAPVYKTYGALIAGGTFEPAGFAAPLGLKDLRLALAAVDSARAGRVVHLAAQPVGDGGRTQA